MDPRMGAAIACALAGTSAVVSIGGAVAGGAVVGAGEGALGQLQQGRRYPAYPRLIQAPRACIDYDILHELFHLKEHNHGKRYYALLARVLPQWRELCERLNSTEFQ